MNDNCNKIVVFTGSFCPPTNAHFELMKTAMNAINASKGIFLPTCDENIKKKMIKKMERLSLSSEVRIKMLNSFCDKYDNLEVSDYEVRTHDSDNTYKSFTHLKNENKGAKIYYLMGADKFKNLPHFKDIELFLNDFNFIVFDRSDINASKVIDNDPLFSKYKDHFVVINSMKDIKTISSTSVRDLFLSGNELYKEYVSKEVSDILSKIDLNDYPVVSDYDFIKFSLNNGPHGITSGCKRVYELNRKLLLNLDLNKMLDSVEYFDSDVINKGDKKYETKVILENKDYDELLKEYDNPFIIVESNYLRCGGKYDQGGSDTLEEELCRISTLSMALYKYGSDKLKCVRNSLVNKLNLYPLKGIIYVSDINLIRYNKNYSYRELENKKIRFNSIMVPSLNLRRVDNMPDGKYLVNDRLNIEGINIMKERLKNAFNIALNKGCENIIINCFGNGFKVPLRDIAIILSDVIKGYKGYFKTIIINDNDRSRNLKRDFYPYLDLGGNV